MTPNSPSSAVSLNSSWHSVAGLTGRSSSSSFLLESHDLHEGSSQISKLNTCLVHTRSVSQGGDYGDNRYSLHFNQVTDVYANRPILFGWFKRISGKEEVLDAPDPDVPNYTSTQFFAEKKEAIL